MESKVVNLAEAERRMVAARAGHRQGRCWPKGTNSPSQDESLRISILSPDPGLSQDLPCSLRCFPSQIPCMVEPTCCLLLRELTHPNLLHLISLPSQGWSPLSPWVLSDDIFPLCPTGSIRRMSGPGFRLHMKPLSMLPFLIPTPHSPVATCPVPLL